MLETRTRLYGANPASRRAISKLVSFSLCFPTPLVKKIFFATNTFHNPRLLGDDSFDENKSRTLAEKDGGVN